MNQRTAIDHILEYKYRFIGGFFVVFTMTYIFFYIIDFLPEAPSEVADEPIVELTDAERETMSDQTDRLQSVSQEPLNIEIVDTAVSPESEQVTATESVLVSPELPVSMYIEPLDRTIDVLNPVSRTIADLDNALLDGVVRHPDSAAPNQDGNVFILGHSSYLPNVFNKNFQAFNGIQNLKWGDSITLTTNQNTYVYRVEKVYRAKASDIVVPIADTGQMLTIATCNSFGSTEDRYILEATLQSVEAV